MTLEQMAEAEHALQLAVSHLPPELCARFTTAESFSDEDRKAILQLARQELTRFQVAPKADAALKQSS